MRQISNFAGFEKCGSNCCLDRANQIQIQEPLVMSEYERNNKKMNTLSPLC